MKGTERRKNIIALLSKAEEPVSGTELAGTFGVSRQVIVQDIALIRAKGYEIESTNRGYRILHRDVAKRVFKVIHTEADVEKELSLIVDEGGFVKDVFVYHRVYGVVRGELNIRSRRDIAEYVEKIRTGKSKLLMNTTSGYHYHTVYAESEEVLNDIQKRLDEAGFLAKLQDYEPVDFWKQAN